MSKRWRSVEEANRLNPLDSRFCFAVYYLPGPSECEGPRHAPYGDGLTNYDEFEAQTDPIRADTDGDGLDDATELAGLAAGIADLDPLAPATFAADEPDADEDGVPDIWEDADIAFFDGVDPDGFPWGADVPEAAGTNYDVRLSVSTSRHAALSWGDGCGESLLLPPCANLALRLRLCADDVKTVALSPSPNAATNPVGTWRGALVADWDARRGLPTEGDRVAVSDGTMVDRSGRESVSVQVWTPEPVRRSGEPRRSGRGGRDAEIVFTPRKLSLSSDGYFCPAHGPEPVVRVSATNAAPPYVWTERGADTVSDDPFYSPSRPFADGHFEVSARWRDGHSALFVSDSIRMDPFGCRPGRTNFVGAAWSSTHDPTNAADHAPGIETHDVSFGPNCPVAHDATVRIGWTHDTTLLWIRNLARICTGDPRDDETDHCIAWDWMENGTFDLMDFVASETIPFMDQISFLVDGAPSSRMVSFGSRPRRYHPKVFHVEMRLNGESRSLDRMWLVVNHPLTRPEFHQWLSANTNDLSWVARLPKPYASIVLTTNAAGVVSAIDPEPGAPGLWTKPSSTKGSFLHHDAEWEMRAYGNSEGHGNQACYDGIGQLIESGISGGTADFSPGFWDTVNSHVENDVNPFLDAVHLDGNPGDTTRMNDISRPCLRQGSAIDSYIFCRPVVKPLSSP